MTQPPASGAPVIAYVTTLTMPSGETDTEQTIRSFEAMHRVDPRCELVAPRTRPERTAQQAINAFYQTEQGLSIRFYRGIGALPGEAERLFHALFAVFRWKGRYDIIQTRSRGTVILAILLGQRAGFETYRMLPITNPLFFRVLRLLAGSRSLLGITCHSHQARESLLEGGIAAEKLKVFHNGFQASVFDPPTSRAEAREKAGLPQDRQIVTYAGNVQKGKGVETLLQLAQMRPNILFSIIGGNPDSLSRIATLARTLQLSNLVLPGRQPPDRVALHLRAADVLVIPPTDEPQRLYRRTLLPMKTFLYLGAGRPILAPATPDLCEVLRHGENAWLVRPDALDDAAAALDRLLSDPELAMRLARGAAETAAHASWDHRATALRDWLIQRFRAAC
jgi:glycosyltransferase involved in cell wall biosynthesis